MNIDLTEAVITTEDVREEWALHRAVTMSAGRAEFDAWLAAHDREAALQLAADVIEMQDDYLPSPGLDPAWIAGWRAAMCHASAKVAREAVR